MGTLNKPDLLKSAKFYSESVQSEIRRILKSRVLLEYVIIEEAIGKLLQDLLLENNFQGKTGPGLRETSENTVTAVMPRGRSWIGMFRPPHVLS